MILIFFLLREGIIKIVFFEIVGNLLLIDFCYFKAFFFKNCCGKGLVEEFGVFF